MTTRTNPRPTHHISLSDGGTTIGLTLCDPRGEPDPRALTESPMPKTVLQTTQGDPDYSSLRLPDVTITQKDWSGGRALARFNKDSTRYLDAEGVNTIMGDMIVGPHATEATGFGTITEQSVGSQTGWLDHDYKVSARPSVSPLVANFTGVIKGIRIQVQRNETCMLTTYPMYIEATIWQDNGVGQPMNVSLAEGRSGILPSGTFESKEIVIPISLLVNNGTRYWIQVQPLLTQGVGGGPPGPQVFARIAYDSSEPGASIYTEASGTFSLYASDQSLVFTVTTEGAGDSILFEYRGTVMALKITDETPGTPKLYMNGWHGRAGANDANKNLLYSNLNLTGFDLTGAIAVIVAGPGSQEQQNWRVITSNQATGEIAVRPAWNVTHTTDTEFAIVSTNRWVELTGHGMSTIPTDVLVVDDILYIAQGNAVANAYIRRGKWTGGGSMEDPAKWTWSPDGTNQADLLKMIPGTDGKRAIWRTLNNLSQAARSDVKAWASDLAFGTAITCGNPSSRITNMLAYGNPQSPHILKEDSFGSIAWNPTDSTGIYAQIPLPEMTAAKDSRNGRGACQFGVYLVFGMKNGMERFYDNRLDDIGPNRDEGHGQDRRGYISQLIPYPGGIIAAYNAGYDGYSAILFWNQLGWHELHRGRQGSRIANMQIQVIPGDTVDRLWFNEGQRMKWIPLSENPRRQDGYLFRTSGEMITSWYQTSFSEIQKYWRSLTIFTDEIQAVTVSYQLDNDSNYWYEIGTYTQVTSEEMALSPNFNVTGKRIRFKFQFINSDQTRSTHLIAWTISAIVRIPPATGWSTTILAASYQQDQQGRWESMNESQLKAQLDAWANSNTNPAPLVMRSADPAYDNRRVFIDPLSVRAVTFTSEANGQVRTKKVYSFSMTELEPVA